MQESAAPGGADNASSGADQAAGQQLGLTSMVVPAPRPSPTPAGFVFPDCQASLYQVSSVAK